MGMIHIRAGLVLPITANVAADPGAIPTTSNAFLHLTRGQATNHVRIKNTGGVAIHIYAKDPVDPAVYGLERYVLDVDEVLDGPYEFKEGMWLMGVGGASSFTALLALRPA